MDFDEYEYLEKSVEDPEAGSKKKEINGEKKERGYRKRDDAGDDDREVGEDDRKRKKSRNEDDNGGERKREDRERSDRRREKEGRHRSDRVRDGDSERDRVRDGERGRDRVRDGERRDRDRERRDRERERIDRERKKEREAKGEEEKERERGREGSRRSSSRARRDDSRERERDKERKEEEEKERGRERDKESKEKEEEKERGRERSRRSSSRAKEKEEEEKERERERERSRRSSSRSRRHGSRELERDKERELREMEIRDGIGRRFKDKKEAVEPEADPERDQRTVFAYQMPLKVTERDVYEFFSKAGKVRDVRLIMDRNARRSKGVGYVEFYDAMSVPMAIALSGQLFLGQPVMVKPSEAEKNLVQSTASGSSVTGPFGPTDRKLYVGNLHFNMSEQDLRQIFESFGPVELVQLPFDLETGHCKGFGFIQFAQAEHAKTALSLNGKIELAGRYIKVSSVTEHIGGQEAGTTAADFDDDDGGGLTLNARSRALLMQKLDRTGTASSLAGSLGVPMHNGSTSVQQPFPLPLNGQTAIPAPTLPGQVLPAPVTEPVGTPSECLLLKNLFDPATETDPEFDLDIKDDVEGECSKFGEVRHIYVDKHSAGHVYLRFVTKEAAMKAQSLMHLRWFAGRLISAVFMQPQDYEAKFRDGA